MILSNNYCQNEQENESESCEKREEKITLAIQSYKELSLNQYMQLKFACSTYKENKTYELLKVNYF